MYDLSVLLSNRDFDLEGIHPEVINYLREVGEGKSMEFHPPFYPKRSITIRICSICTVFHIPRIR